MEDSLTCLFLRLDTREDALDLLTVLCAEFLRQDGRRNECSTPFAQSVPSWSAHYITPSYSEPLVPLLTPVMALQMFKSHFEHDAAADDHKDTHPLSMYWTLLRALVLVVLMYDGRMRRLFLSSPNPVWPSPAPARAQLFLRPGGPFQKEVNAFLAVHSRTHSFKDAHRMANQFVMRADTLWMKTVFVTDKYSTKLYHMFQSSIFARRHRGHHGRLRKGMRAGVHANIDLGHGARKHDIQPAVAQHVQVPAHEQGHDRWRVLLVHEFALARTGLEGAHELADLRYK